MKMANVQCTEPVAETPDADLISRSLAGNEQAYAQIVERYQRKIFRIALAIVRNEMDADLVTQDTFVQAYLSLGKFERRAGLETWLTRIAINRGRDVLRARKWTFLPWSSRDEDGETVGIDLADGRPDAENEALGGEIGRAIERAIEHLSEQQKTIFTLRHFEDLSLEDIARLLKLRPGTVRAHLFRAVHKVRKELRSWLPEHPEFEGPI
ncbi:MAG TPA: sigma-70 family RNA polymerase sigma factor [Thermoanaerobaculia bacterium]|nr:sigma-70 family RNA polymerase sigma factor [Thermoanaerobaculia bacterium]